ncbi:hypothetical protein HDU82_008073 [Entophlyctis luteolus]|nr:hypothetical protein HDU82_008073 [Entophlyctis luteolus]
MQYNQPLFNNKQLQWPASIASTVSTNIMQVSRPQNPLSIDRVATLRAVLRGHDVVHGVLHRSSPILSSPNFPSEVPQDMLRKRSLFRGVKGLILCVVAYFGRTLYMFDVVGSAAPSPGPGPRLADGSLATSEAALLTQVPRNRFSFSSDGSAEPAYRDDYPRALLDARPAVAMRLATAAVAEHSVGILRVCGLDLLLGSGSFQDVYLLAAGRDEMAAWVCVLKSLI